MDVLARCGCARPESAEAAGPLDRFAGAAAAPQKDGLKGKICTAADFHYIARLAAGGLVLGFRTNNSLVL